MFMDSGAKLIVAEWATRYGNDAGIVFGMECGDTRKFVPRYTTILHTHTHIYIIVLQRWYRYSQRD